MAPSKSKTTSSSSSSSTKKRSSTSNSSISRSSTSSSTNSDKKPSLSSSFTSTKSSNVTSGLKKSGSVGVSTSIKEEPVKAIDDEEKKLVKDHKELIRESRKIMGPAIHDQDWAPLEVVLRVFDADADYGPCSNQSRLERFERAQRLGLDPPEQIGAILRSKIGMTRPEYKNSVFSV